ncbi:MAG: hypothetical protein M1830_007717, partial [Pleopsidium flavum]
LQDALRRCYRRGWLSQPHAGDIDLLRDHACIILLALDLFNIWFSRGQLSALDLFPNATFYEMLALTIGDLLGSIRPRPARLANAQMAEGAIFRAQDLNIKAVTGVGRLRIQWTPYLDEHLHLNHGKMELKVFWFGWPLLHLPFAG